MPRAFTDSERTHIRECLIGAASDCLRLYGIRRTTVDELVRRCRIPKGTFYLFYRSKELLFYDVFCRLHDEFQQKVMAEAARLRAGLDAERLTGMLFRLYQTLDDSLLQGLLASGELERLFRALPDDVSRMHAEADDLRVEELVSFVPGMRTDRIPVFSGAIRGVFATMLHKRDIGEDVFDDALLILLRGVVSQMFEESGS